MVGKKCIPVFLMVLLLLSLAAADVRFQINYSSDMPRAVSENRVESMVSQALDFDEDEYFEARVLVTDAHFDVVALRSDRYSADLFRIFVEDTVVTRVSEELYDDFYEEPGESDSEETGCPSESYNCPDPDVQVLLSAITEFNTAWQNGRAARDALQNAGVNVVYLEGRQEAKTTILNYLSCPNLVLWGRIGHGDQRGALHLDDGSSFSARDLNSARAQDRVFPLNCCYVGNSSLSTAFMSNGATYMSAGNNVPLMVGSSEPAWRGFVVSTVTDRTDLRSAWQTKQNHSSRDNWALNIKSGGPHYIDLDDPVTLTLLSPSDGDVLQAESEHTIRWESEGDIENVQLEWGHVDGEWSTVAGSVSNSGSHTWNVPDTAHEQCAFRISEVGGDASHTVEYFSIIQKPSISVPDLVIDTSLRNNEEVHYDLDIDNVGRGVLNARFSQTSFPSDLIEVAGWSGDADDFGSEIDTGNGIIQKGSALMEYSIVEQPDDDSWPWAIMTAALDKDFSGLEHIEISYTSDHEVSLLLDQTGLSETGTSHRAVLPPSGSVKDTVLHVSQDFSQPDWVENTTSLDLSEVESASFSISPEYTRMTQGKIRVESMSLEGVDLPITESPVSVNTKELEISGGSSETVRISLSSADYEIGEYRDTVVIRHNDPDVDAIGIPVRLTIRENRNPEFDNVDTEYKLNPGEEFEVEISAADPDDDGVTIGTEDLPAWLSADDSESGVLRIFGSTDDSHADTDYSFRVVAEDDFDPVGQAELEITIKIGTDIIETDTLSGTQVGIFPAQNPGGLDAENFDFTVMTGDAATVRIVIYDNLGNILDEQTRAGSTASGHVLSWDMCNASGQKVSAGSYLIGAEVTYENGTKFYLHEMIGLRQ
ncbi:MAG: FlgD immunoglobulin-like domain containing protein [Fibrobacterota bacterium]